MSQTAKVIKIDQLVVQEFNIQEITEANLELMQKQILEIPAIPEDKEQYNSVKDMHIAAKKILPKIEERRKELKAPILEKGKKIDKTAKQAVNMVQPLIEMSGERRFAWEKIADEKKAEADRIEAERVEKLEDLMKALEVYCTDGLVYNMPSDHIEFCLEELKNSIISEVYYQERTEEAEKMLARGISDTKQALENRLKFEADRDEAARIKKENAAKEKELAEKQAKFEADQKAAQAKADKNAAEEAKKTRLANEKIEAARKALEKEKAAIAAKKQADENAKRLAMEIEAHKMNAVFIPPGAIQMNIEFDNARARRIKKEESDRKEKLKADKTRAKLIKSDKEIITNMVNTIDTFISGLSFPELQTDEANRLIVLAYEKIKSTINTLETQGSELA